MDDNTANPYESSAMAPQRRHPIISYSTIGGMIICLFWLAISVGVRVGQSQMRLVYDDFGTKLPFLTRIVLSSAIPICCVAIGTISRVLISRIQNDHDRRKLQFGSFLLAFVICGVVVIGLFIPLTSIMSSLS